MTLTYHQQTAALLDRPLAVSPTALALLEERERDLGVRFPASVREWYCLDGANAILAAHSNMDQPVLWAELGEPERDWHGSGPQDLVAEGLLVILNENQHVAQWAVRVDNSNDPPVLVRVVDATPIRDWRHYADSFSTFIYTQVWDWSGVFEAVGGQGDGCLVQADDRSLTANDLALLQRWFADEPRTYIWPTPITYRFSAGKTRIRVWNGEDGAFWMVGATTPDETIRLVRQFRQCGLLTGQLDPLTDSGEEAVASLRR